MNRKVWSFVENHSCFFRGAQKKGVLGEGILMMYRLALVTVIAFIVFGVSSVFYDHYIDVRDAEAVIMTRVVVDCVAPEGAVNLSLLDEGVDVLSYCGFDDDEVERFYVRVNVSDDGGDVLEMEQGDSGALWVLAIYDSVDLVADGIVKYEPGYSDRVYDVIVFENDVESFGKVEVEVFVQDE